MDTTTAPVSSTVRTISGEEETSATVVSAVADAKGVDPLDLDPLYDWVDADALDAIFSPSEGAAPASAELRFSMDDCEVVVRGTGEVVVATGAEHASAKSVVAGED